MTASRSGTSSVRRHHQRPFPTASFVECLDALAEQAGVEGRGRHGAPASGGMRRPAMHVWYRVAGNEFQPRIRARKFHHARRRLQIQAGKRVVVMRTEFMPQVSQWLLNVFSKARLDGQRIARYPHPSARLCGRPAVLRFFLGNDDLQAVVRGGDCGGQSARAGTDDQKIAVTQLSHRRCQRCAST